MHFLTWPSLSFTDWKHSILFSFSSLHVSHASYLIFQNAKPTHPRNEKRNTKYWYAKMRNIIVAYRMCLADIIIFFFILSYRINHTVETSLFWKINISATSIYFAFKLSLRYWCSYYATPLYAKIVRFLT